MCYILLHYEEQRVKDIKFLGFVVGRFCCIMYKLHLLQLCFIEK
jgi:hypothetical protein